MHDDKIQLRTMDADWLEHCQMNEILILVKVPAGHIALDGDDGEPLEVTLVTTDGAEFMGFAMTPQLRPDGQVRARITVS